jgi:uncharacterized SAM-binding protein YcdF (DUF218 family)
MLLAPFRWAFRFLALVVLIVVIYFLVTLTQVWLTSRQYNPHPAGAIVVMGAAQYDGVPSPDLAARLDEANILYKAGDAGLIVVTGSKQPGDQYTEAEAGATYLEKNGVPASAILQAGGSDSYENISGADQELKARHINYVLIATDPFHEDRSMAIASDFGLSPSPTPTKDSPIHGWATVPYFLKEAVGVGLGRIVGYNHLEWIHDA